MEDGKRCETNGFKSNGKQQKKNDTSIKEYRFVDEEVEEAQKKQQKKKLNRNKYNAI